MLLFHRGLGMEGEMDDAAQEEAGFREWVANHENAGVDESGAAVGVAQGMISIPEDDSEDELGDAAAVTSGPGPSIGGIPEAELEQAIKIALGVLSSQLFRLLACDTVASVPAFPNPVDCQVVIVRSPGMH